MSAQGSSENEKSQEASVTTEQQPTEEYKPVVFQLEQLDSYTATDPVTKEVQPHSLHCILVLKQCTAVYYTYTS